MKHFDVTVKVEQLSYDELTAADKELVDAAKEATKGSLAPYSHFHVGAAMRMADGSIHTGANQENAALPSSTCAERTCAYHAGAVKPGMPMKKIAIAAWSKSGKPEGLGYDEYFQALPISPCGACRQALMEYENMYGPMEVLLYGKEAIYRLPSIASLLPLTFTEF